MNQTQFVIITRAHEWCANGFACEVQAAEKVVKALNESEPEGAGDWQITSVAIPASEIEPTFSDWQEKNL